jgi:hypothetical protein
MTDMPGRTFPAVTELIREAESIAAEQHDPVQLLSEFIELAPKQVADPYLLLDVLVDGLARVLSCQIPPSRHAPLATELLLSLHNRLRRHGADC